MESETLFIQQYPAYGYEVRTELVTHEDSDPVKLSSAYTMPAGYYIGDRETAKFLCEERGIKPETISPEHKVCSIGLCEKEQKWYGWSHRAIFGFGIGSEVKKGDVGYVPDNAEELQDAYIDWNDFVDVVDDETIRISGLQCDIVGENDDGSLILKESDSQESYTVKTGRGEWTAETLEDARQMAIDFANGVA